MYEIVDNLSKLTGNSGFRTITLRRDDMIIANN
jgi:hypothetical protein